MPFLPYRVFDDLRRIFVGAGDEHELAARLDQLGGALVERALVVFVGIGQVSHLEAVGSEDRCLRQQKLAQRMRHLLGREFIAAPRCEHRIQDQRHVGVVGHDLGDHRDVLDTSQHADLEGIDRHILEQAPRLVGHPVGIDGEHALHAQRVLHRQRGDDG